MQYYKWHWKCILKSKPISSFDACRNNSRRPGSNVESQLSEVYTFHQDIEPNKRRPTDSNFQNYNFPIKLMYKRQNFLWERIACIRLFFHSLHWKKSQLKFSPVRTSIPCQRTKKNKKDTGHILNAASWALLKNILYIAC